LGGAGRAASAALQLAGQRIVLAERSHQLGTPADGQDRAADDLLDVDRHQHRGLDHAALGIGLGIVEAALG
jgi:shikimate 5-dehydrogenase